MRILLTGGSGFVGSHLVPRLAERAHELFCVHRAAQAQAGEALVWDGADKLPKRNFPANIDAVIHLAQSRVFRNFPTDASEMFDINVRMTAELLHWAAEAGVKQFVLASSGAVYEPFIGLLQEDSALAPKSFLGATKLAAEVLARPYATMFNLSVLRLFFPYGPGQRDRLIPDLIRRVRTRQAVHLGEDGEGLQFAPIFIDDVVSSFSECVEKGWTGTFNVTTAERVSIRRATSLIAEFLHEPTHYETVKQPAIIIDPDVSLLAERMDITRFTRFADGLRATVAALN